MSEDQMALIAKALAHPLRIRIVRLLATQAECRGHEVFSGFSLAQSTISGHLRILKDAGLVRSQPVGTSTMYCLVASVLSEFNTAIEEILATTVRCVPGEGAC